MATIDQLNLGGADSSDAHGNPYRSAISYRLQKESSLSFLEVMDGWEVESNKGSVTIVARTTDGLDRESTVDFGTERIQRCLDLIAFERLIYIELSGSGDEHMVLYIRDDQQVLEHFSTCDFSMGMSSQITVKDKDGNIIPNQPLPPSVWIPALRYYRLSQSSSNLYEAYRNLWLGLESLLSTIQPIANREKEGTWLRRALTHVTTNVNLQHYLPSTCTDVVDYLMNEQYVAMRCNLFHAKHEMTTDVTTIPNPERVSIAYGQLIMIWRVIAQHFTGVRSLGGGVVTYQGFKHMMDLTFASNLGMSCTGDPTPPNKGDTAVSPAGYPVIYFDETTYLSELTPGRVAIFGRLIFARHPSIPSLHRITSCIQDKMFNVSYIKGGLTLSGIDLFESIQVIRLHNQGTPRTQF
ncbi:hypothetical protein B0F87_11311 [Methylobacter tundripaludum]|uniref:Uncharacterized protein n=1 Tax=Methylobacter tundripaludum TaxID=173365 RepID=A0A2S6H904_9GAMM|nr:hypothetical protein [Methylobacter tundripaludum]PPK73900.1 hypothetical protein B0F87_11311 [Methylobacter tundripaludum]